RGTTGASRRAPVRAEEPPPPMPTPTARSLSFAACRASVALLSACAAVSDSSTEVEDTDQGGRRFTSAQAALVTLDFDGELAAPWQAGTSKLIQTQLFYTVGQLNAHRALGRLDQAVITNVKTSSNGADGWMKVTYHASLPVGWGDKTAVPS